MLSRLRTWHLRTGFSAVIKKGVNGAATLVFFSSQTISRQKYFVAEFCALSRHSIPSCHSESLETESIAPSIRGEKKKHPERKPDCKGGGGEQVTCIFATSLNSSFRLFAASVGRSFSINQRWFSTRTVGTGGPVDQNKPQREVTGSGFVISRRRIVTNAHVVADQTFVLVCKHGSPIKYRADVEAVGHECDLALLRVRSEEFWEGMRELDFGDIPFLQESVAVVGYPQGGDNISVTGGVVSRVEPTQYVHGAAHLMAIQIDAAINPGNSGGPALMEDKVVGVAFQNLAGAENIGYIIPVPVINHFLSDVEETGRYVGFCSLGVTCQPTENVQLRDHLRMPLGLTGVLINKIHPLTNTSRCLQKDDVILAFDGTPIANDGTGHIEKFWLDFLADPSALWDHHLSEKVSPKYLDFKHKKKTHEAFWRWKPPWVEAAEMATYKSLLQKCTYSKNLAEGRNVHLHIIESGVKPSTSLSNAILNMYCKCGSLIEAQKVFDAIPEKDIITWTLMLVAYASHGLNGEGFKLYKQVCDEGLRCDRIMYTSIVSICASLGDLEKAKAVHNDIIKSGIGTDAILENNLVHMYARCGSMELAHDVFHKMVERNVVSWNAMIAGSAQNGNAEETCHLFQQMQQESIQPDHITFMSLLNACTSPATYKQGCWVHANILNTGWDADVRVGTALVSMFAKCGRIHDARQVFDKMKVRDVISWTAMINGYADHGPYGKAMELFRQMEQFGMAPNTVTFIGLLKACANQASLQEARWVHASIVAAALDSDLRVRNGLIDMYAKCGSLEDAFSIFSTMSEKDVVTWSAMIAGFGQHGHGRAALEHFDQMVSEGVHPNSVTFVGVLSACSHAGLVVEGLRCFHLMVKDYSISPALDHFGCVVDLLGRAGHLHEAEDFLNKMPQTPGTSTWGPLLSACRIHGNVQLAERSGTNFKIVTFNRESSLVHNDFKT